MSTSNQTMTESTLLRITKIAISIYVVYQAAELLSDFKHRTGLSDAGEYDTLISIGLSTLLYLSVIYWQRKPTAAFATLTVFYILTSWYIAQGLLDLSFYALALITWLLTLVAWRAAVNRQPKA